MGLRELLSRLGRRLGETESKAEAQIQAPAKPSSGEGARRKSSSRRSIVETLGSVGSRLLDFVSAEPAPVRVGPELTGEAGPGVDLFSPEFLDSFGSGGRRPRRRRGGSRRRRRRRRR